ncbi:uncharacterized protein [Nothobranchius furzeri]|uniref:uncharacterized protein n=1 Tax=Nothobranchius furzeri TaxID=105023 RepID=UPI00390481E6
MWCFVRRVSVFLQVFLASPRRNMCTVVRLLHIRRSKICQVLNTNAEMLREIGLLRQPASWPSNSQDSPATPPWARRRRKQCATTRKRGKRGGVRVRLEAKPTRPAIPSLLLANVRSLDNKMDSIRLLRSANRSVSDCCVLVFIETWLNDNIPDSAIQLEQLACYRVDRALIDGGKTRGGGVCVYICDEWCRDATVVRKHCSSLAELMIVKCRPFYLPREVSSILLVATYIPPSSNNSDRNAALNELHQTISEQQTAHPDGFIILAGDFNHVDLKTVLPKFHQHVHFPTRGDDILDLVYTQEKGAYKAIPLPHIGTSDHLTVMLMPSYRQRVKVIKP